MSADGNPRGEAAGKFPVPPADNNSRPPAGNDAPAGRLAGSDYRAAGDQAKATFAGDDSAEKLLESMRREARAEKERIGTEAAEECAAIEREYTQELERIRTEAKQAVERELPMIRDRLVGKAVREGHVERARIKQEFLERVFDEARRALAALAESAEYPAVLQGLVSELGEKLNGEVVLEIPEKDVKPATEAIKKAGLDWTVRAGGAEAGNLVAETADGLERMDNGLFTRLRRAEHVLSAEVASILFDDGGQREP